ncbi:MAG: hypothetical protein A2X61_07740 [Ignavibacteria bacterium GWB2_35_12]|nr:MAG: hypothetical protein A2X63_11815 [Ignavibacteria bacterium GWA2_35_8]OGU39478.1 MAG: hypothetical protein A2X61_07740 [Ignavibacteria bacterium GWB2_35_12]OGU90176.1 MAG: hypothetical protein A2220_16315 [Ignavibacteria bacterium RIFOXYA2_FULL_35_10]OGV21910.1 MAG: hypothetical protein A2475_09820 [Ignavibacteria bacterium RIFOXYC2_FULL_35_21]
MKTKLMLIVFAGLWLVLFRLPLLVKAQITDTCWCIPKYYPPNGEFFNEHFKYDTCNVEFASSSCDSVYWLNMNRTTDGRNRIYAKHEWLVWFDVKAFPLPYYPPDTLIEVTWRDVDSINYPEIKDSLRMIENEYGNNKMIKLHPDLNQPGSGQTFRVFFDNYLIGVELENKYNAIPFANCGFKAGRLDIDNIDDFSKGHNTEINISPNPANDYLYIHKQNNNHNNIIITSVTGEVLLTIESNNEEEQKINIQNLSPGIYFLRIGNVCKKFIVNR